jgi:uncharacterized protein (TIGR02001 family)
MRTVDAHGKFGRARARAVAIAAPVFCFALGGSPAPAQILEQTSADNPAAAISLGGRGWSASETVRAAPPKDRMTDPLEFSAKVGAATDYVYRGTTLSDRKPAVGGAIEATFAKFYAGATAASVKLPTEPVAEITMGGGVRPTIGNIDFDFGVTYFHYPGERVSGPTNGIDYWEAAGRADTRIGESVRIAGGFAYSPNVSNTGAWSQYAAFGMGIEVPSRLLPQNVSVSFTSGAGYSWFGHEAAALGGFGLPAYLNWQAGVTLTRSNFNMDLRYYDTNLSPENCFVFTGDPNARPGGRVDPVTNPDGLVSRWCSATFVAKVWFALN